jgi:glycine cleavage system aminomethyltransferase T
VVASVVEVHVPAGHGEVLWRCLLGAARVLGGRPVGLEAAGELSLERVDG